MMNNFLNLDHPQLSGHNLIILEALGEIFYNRSLLDPKNHLKNLIVDSQNYWGHLRNTR